MCTEYCCSVGRQLVPFMSVHRSPEHYKILEETDTSQQEVEGGGYRLTELLSTSPASSHTLYIRYAKWLDIMLSWCEFSVCNCVHVEIVVSIPPTLTDIDPTPHQLVSLLDELPSLQALVLDGCSSSTRYVSLLLFCTECKWTHCVCVTTYYPVRLHKG